MFRLFGPKRHNAPAIAHTVINAATDPSILERFIKAFASSDEEVPRVIFSVIVFAYCWSRSWAVSKQDARVCQAYTDAAKFIVSRFKSAGKLVRISDYVVSELETSQLSLDLMEYFREQVPPKVDGDSAAEMMAQIRAHEETIMAQRIPFRTLASAIIEMRNKRMADELSTCSNEEEYEAMMVRLSGTLYDQIRGIQHRAMNPSEVEDVVWEIFQPGKLLAITSLISRLGTELEAL